MYNQELGDARSRFQYTIIGSFLSGIIGFVIWLFFLASVVGKESCDFIAGPVDCFKLALTLLPLILIPFAFLGFIVAAITYKSKERKMFLDKPKWWIIPVIIILLVVLYKLFYACLINKVCGF